MQEDGQHRSVTNVMEKNVKEKEFKTMWSGMVESHESTRQRPESLQSEIHEDRIAGKGFTSMTLHNLVHKFVPMPQAMKIPAAKAAVEKEWKSSRQFQHGNSEKSRIKRRLCWKGKGTQ